MDQLVSCQELRYDLCTVSNKKFKCSLHTLQTNQDVQKGRLERVGGGGRSWKELCWACLMLYVTLMLLFMILCEVISSTVTVYGRILCEVISSTVTVYGSFYHAYESIDAYYAYHCWEPPVSIKRCPTLSLIDYVPWLLSPRVRSPISKKSKRPWQKIIASSQHRRSYPISQQQ